MQQRPLILGSLWLLLGAGACNTNKAALVNPNDSSASEQLQSGSNNLTEQACRFASSNDGAAFAPQPGVPYLIVAGNRQNALGISSDNVANDAAPLQISSRTNGLNQLFRVTQQASGAYSFALLVNGLELNSSANRAARQLSAQNGSHYNVVSNGGRFLLINAQTQSCLTESNANQRFALLPFKRGLATPNPDGATRTQMVKAAWFYNWDSAPNGQVPNTVEYTPMIIAYPPSTAQAPLQDISNSLAQIASNGYAKVLAYNEPDAHQADGSSRVNVNDAIASWPTFIASGLQLGSPAAVNALESSWLATFMQGVDVNHVDFITMHWYGWSGSAAVTAQYFLGAVKDVYKKYQKPIWITEFSLADFAVSNASNDPYSVQDMVDFLNKVLPELDALPYVQRYYLQDASPQNTNAGSLNESDNSLTAVGQAYAKQPL